MPGIGVRLWNPPYKSGGPENPLTVVNLTVADAIGLNGTTVPFKSYTGNILVRMVGRANTATRPLAITVKWGAVTMVQKAFYAEAGAGGTFTGLWTLAGQTPASASIQITCVANTAGVTAIRIGEIGGPLTQIISDAGVGTFMTMLKNQTDALLTVAGFADATADPLTSTDLDPQWTVKIPAKTSLPNRHDGLSAHFGLTYTKTTDNVYRVRTQATVVNISGAYGSLVLRLGAGKTAHAA